MSDVFVYLGCLSLMLVVGVYFARRWVVAPPPKVLRFPRWLRVAALFFASWVGTFVAHAFARKVNFFLNDGIAYDEGAVLPYNVMNDGVGDNVMCLLLGWAAGFLFWGIAAALKTEH